LQKKSHVFVEGLPRFRCFEYLDKHNTLITNESCLKFNQEKLEFVEKAKKIISLRHQSILPMYDYFEYDEEVYVATALPYGEPLESLLCRFGPPTEIGLRNMLLAILDNLNYFHEKSVFHLGIRPEAIYTRGKQKPLLTDFQYSLIFNGQRLAGTENIRPNAYQAFEVSTIKGGGKFSDIYALGAVLYRSITGRAPINAIDRIIEDKLPLLSKNYAIRYSAELLETIDKALAPRPKDRWQNCKEWKAALCPSFKTKLVSVFNLNRFAAP
jgi:non-specific serine/threonine protein kinase